MTTIHIKPISANRAFQGRRFKTPTYTAYETELCFLLPKIKVPTGKLELHYVFGMSNKNSDLGNLEKQTTDILSKRYGFNDKNLYRIILERQDVKKGSEFVSFEFNEI